MEQATLRIIMEPEKPAAIEKVLAPVLEAIPAQLTSTETYAKGGTDALLKLTIPDTTWPEHVMELIRIAQYLGYGWHISGSIDDEISLTCEKFRFTGIRWANIEASRD